MKKLFNHQQEPTVPRPEACSEEKCKTCFENRGCIYEQYSQYSAMTIHKTGDAYLAVNINGVIRLLSRRAS